MNTVDYKILKPLVLKACKVKDGNDFEVEYEKLVNLVADIGLEPIFINFRSKRIEPELVPYLSEYFEKSRLSWFTEGKYSLIIAFVDSSAIDDTCRDLLDEMKTSLIDDPDLDKLNIYATLVANYPCYFANIISYQSNDPSRVGRPSYEIVCRSNKVVIKSSTYIYNPKDFS